MAMPVLSGMADKPAIGWAIGSSAPHGQLLRLQPDNIIIESGLGLIYTVKNQASG
jgi:hypothetical protein